MQNSRLISNPPNNLTAAPPVSAPLPASAPKQGTSFLVRLTALSDCVQSVKERCIVRSDVVFRGLTPKLLRGRSRSSAAILRSRRNCQWAFRLRRPDLCHRSTRREIFRTGTSARTPDLAGLRPSSLRQRRASPTPRGCCGGLSCRRFCGSVSTPSHISAAAAIVCGPVEFRPADRTAYSFRECVA